MAEVAAIDIPRKTIAKEFLHGLYNFIKSRGKIQVCDYTEYDVMEGKSVLKKDLPDDFPKNITTYGSLGGMISLLKKTGAIKFGKLKGDYEIDSEVEVVFEGRVKKTKEPKIDIVTEEAKHDCPQETITLEIPINLSGLNLPKEPILSKGTIIKSWNDVTHELIISIALELCLQLSDSSGQKEGEGNG